MRSEQLVIGIAGGTGSGKTTVAKRIVEALPAGEALLVQHDWYYRDRADLSREERDKLNFDEPDALENDLLATHLTELREGRGIDAPQYEYATHTRLPTTLRVDARPIIVVEGILLFAVPALRDRFDLRLFVDTDDDVRLLRRIKRDIRDRGRDIESIQRQYMGTVRPMHEQHVAPTKRYAHLVIPEGGKNAEAIDVVVGRLMHALGTMGRLRG